MTSTVAPRLLLLAATALLTACGGGGGGGGADGSSGSTSTIYYPSGAVQATGPVDATGKRSGEWTFYFEDGGTQWQAGYTDGAFDPAKPWVEQNADGSVRYDHTDGPAPHLPPL